MTTGFRTLFLGRDPSWEAWLEALEKNRVAAVRHDALSGFKTWIHAANNEVLQIIKQRELSWRWWDNPDIGRPLVSVVALNPGDLFEMGRPAEGINVRIRCAWENTALGRPKQPISELLGVKVDGREVKPELVRPRPPNGIGYVDYYHLVRLPKLSPGQHRAVAEVRVLETGATVTRDCEFVA